jgi:diguanylate cyclase (GGDEF)-like protein
VNALRERIGARFFLVLSLLLVGMLAIAGAGLVGLVKMRGEVSSIYDHDRDTRIIADLGDTLDNVDEVALQLALTADPASTRTLEKGLRDHLAPRVDADLAAAGPALADLSLEQRAPLERVARGWADFKDLWGTQGLVPSSADLAARGQISAKLAAVFTPLKASFNELNATESTESQASRQNAERAYLRIAFITLLIVVTAVTLGVAAVAWLIRSVLGRILTYSEFASKVSAGELGGELNPKGHDELDHLGGVLDDIVNTARLDRNYGQTQQEFADSMQLAENEQEVHRLLKRHLERSIPGSSVTVLNRNNSADRLEAMTAVPADSPLTGSLPGARPRSCQAVRSANVHRETRGQDALMQCDVCGGCGPLTTCVPLLVGGEVIGSVLAVHNRALESQEDRRMRESVTQGAPVLANLRNLAIAELRASTDPLTGLPNRRAMAEAVKRMVAHASRVVAPLSLLLLDLDHFKQINDKYGHARGDQVLASVGATLRSMMRESDFTGRFGGEEFIVLLPATGFEGALTLAEKIRAAVAQIVIPTVERPISTSIGIAVFPDHGRDSETLERSADRALYLAKKNGRNRVEVASEEARLDEAAGAVPSDAPLG